MAITFTRHRLGARDVLGPQEGPKVTVADDAVSEALPVGMYRVVATSPCVVRIGHGLTDATGGEDWLVEGQTEAREVLDGMVIAVDAA